LPPGAGCGRSSCDGTDRALAKAASGGVAYDGPDAQEIVEAMDTLVRDVNNASAGIVR
jgi:hypothetical protein